MIPGGIHPLLLAGGASVRVQDVFATSLYTGNGATQTITNGIDLVDEGGLVWVKRRNSTTPHELTDTARGANKRLSTNYTDAEAASSDVVGFTNSGFNLGYNTGWGNISGGSFASWTFRQAPDFFGIVTYTGNGVAGRQIDISHLGFTKPPGMVVCKRLDNTSNWHVQHRSYGGQYGLLLNSANSLDASSSYWNNTTATAAVVTLGGFNNASGATYVMYVFGHNTDAEGLIQCGGYVGNGSSTGPTVTLGWEPQFLLLKNTQSAYDWFLLDAARGIEGTSYPLRPNTSGAENAQAQMIDLLPDGFQLTSTSQSINELNRSIAYMAIRAAA